MNVLHWLWATQAGRRLGLWLPGRDRFLDNKFVNVGSSLCTPRGGVTLLPAWIITIQEMCQAWIGPAGWVHTYVSSMPTQWSQLTGITGTTHRLLHTRWMVNISSLLLYIHCSKPFYSFWIGNCAYLHCRMTRTAGCHSSQLESLESPCMETVVYCLPRFKSLRHHLPDQQISVTCLIRDKKGPAHWGGIYLLNVIWQHGYVATLVKLNWTIKWIQFR